MELIVAFGVPGIVISWIYLPPPDSHVSFYSFFFPGGTQYDQSHIILNTVNQEKITQVWEAMVL